jgi:(R)-2-hydroxyacyl-CoA dehydratese activating ATPase
MITAGIDSGFQNTKVVILGDGKILSQMVTRNERESGDSVARRALDEACRKANLSERDIEKTVATGAGRKQISFDVHWASEAMCLVLGANFYLPTTKTVLDVGAYKSMALSCDGVRLRRVSQNTKCAASSGMYLERVAAVLHIEVEEMGSLSRLSTEKVEVSGSCAVFGESAVISLLHLKKEFRTY